MPAWHAVSTLALPGARGRGTNRFNVITKLQSTCVAVYSPGHPGALSYYIVNDDGVMARGFYAGGRLLAAHYTGYTLHNRKFEPVSCQLLARRGVQE